MTTEEAQKTLEYYIKFVEEQEQDESLVESTFVEAARKVIKKLNEEQKKNLVLRRQRDDARKSVQEACENALEYSDKWVIATNTIDRAKKHIEEDMAHNNQFNCGDLQLILDILEDEE